MKKSKTENMLRAMCKIYLPGGTNNRQVVEQLLENGEMKPVDIARALGKSHSTVSIALTSLRRSGVVVFRREGRTTFYRLKNLEDMAYWQRRLMDIVEDWDRHIRPEFVQKLECRPVEVKVLKTEEDIIFNLDKPYEAAEEDVPDEITWNPPTF